MLKTELRSSASDSHDVPPTAWRVMPTSACASGGTARLARMAEASAVVSTCAWADVRLLPPTDRVASSEATTGARSERFHTKR
ncbi:hypothetical protein P6166_14800 [Stenotrophomonas sp. HITSZ_GD]|uniref:hypothetical protein n=1 Tax=Stenotrophomonas sp. HITSZ_GD TaxID=3037248 RepID=UPI00240D4D19|nr:hypothetical protein [Stenotrophomonas sp. HITSZ_GD]MDG2526622.1 hypothetical protein [Stenotrophomonas sp. HITSZ_GD]